MHHMKRHQARVETASEDEDEEGTLDDYHQDNSESNAGWNTGFGESWGIRPADSASNFNGDTWQHASVASPHQQTRMNAVRDWGIPVAAPSPPAKPVQMRHASAAAHDMAGMLTAALTQQQQAHNQELQRQAQQQRQQLYQTMQQQPQHKRQSQHQAHRETNRPQQSQMSKVASKLDQRTSASSPMRDGGTGGWGSQTWGTQEVGGQEMGGPGRGTESGWGEVTGGGWGVTNEGSAWGARSNNQHPQPDPWGTSVTPGGFGARDNLPASNANAPNRKARSPAMVQSQSWGGWDPQNPNQTGTLHDENIPALIVTSPTTVHAETVTTEKKQTRSLGGILSRAFKSRQNQKVKIKEAVPSEGQNVKKSKTLKKQKFAESPAETWPDVIQEEGWDGEQDEEDPDEHAQDWNAPGQSGGWFSEAGTGWNDPTFPMHSKAYALAAQNRVPPTTLFHTQEYDGTDHAIIDAQGAALEPAQRAFYSKERLARDRFHWFFDPGKDTRVASLLDWIQKMRYDVAMFGFSKFLETRERGALFANADYRPLSSPHEPAFDWLTYNNIQATMDKTLQESLAFYDPNVQVLVFVFLLSESQNSMAIWRRKLPLPNNLRLAYGPQLKQATAGLQKTYPIHVDELPRDDKGLPAAPQATTQPLKRSDSAKRKWFQWGR